MNAPQFPADGGMLYAETDLGKLFPEPLNALTSLLFLLLALYWIWRLKGRFRSHVYLSLSVLLLLIGAIGGSIYHGLRQWPVFIVMDWLPITLICVFTGVYFLARLTRWTYALLIVLGYVAFEYFIRKQILSHDDIQLYINLNYAVLGSLVLFPVLAFLIKNHFRHGRLVIFALSAFVLALFFRVADKWELLPFGTHFLWHSFGAVAAYCMLEFVYRVNPSEARPVR